jgi:hypothetical protein
MNIVSKDWNVIMIGSTKLSYEVSFMIRNNICAKPEFVLNKLCK